MQRRDFLNASAKAGAVAAILPGRAMADTLKAPTPAPRLFEVTTTIDLAQTTGPVQLWLPLFHSAPAYQKLLSHSWTGTGAARVVRDAHYGADILHARWDDGTTPRQLSLVQHVATWERSNSGPARQISAAERRFWTAPSAGIPTDGIVRDTARQIVGTLTEPKAQLRALYDWVVATTWRDAATPGCGTGNVADMLENKHFGGKCVDINSLMVALARSLGMPARDVYGIRLAGSKLAKSLGRNGDVSGAQHCRAEVWLDGAGWFAVDPADVRKSVLEDKLPVDSPAIRQLADHLFGAWESNWAGYNSATGVTLAGAPHAPAYDFLMYPEAMTPTATLNCLDAAHFAYRITSAEVTA